MESGLNWNECARSMIIEMTRKKAELPIGSRIKERRKSLGMTLQQLAAESGLSAPFISQVERNKAAPSIVSLTNLAKALRVEIAYFLQVPSDSSGIRRAKRRRRILVESPVDYFQLSANLADQKMDAILMRIPAGHEFPVDQRQGEDFLYVLEGSLEIVTGETRAILKPGDSIHFDSRIPHSANNRTNREVTLLYVGTPSIFRDSN